MESTEARARTVKIEPQEQLAKTLLTEEASTQTVEMISLESMMISTALKGVNQVMQERTSMEATLRSPDMARETARRAL